jgi:HAD superfamily phosphatase (TIGR01668 family)
MTWRKRLFEPTSYASRISQISHDALLAGGVRGVIVDLDNTLVGFRATEPEREEIAWVARAAERGIRVVMVTNNRTTWAHAMAAALDVAIVPNARKPFPIGFRRGLDVLGLDRSCVVVIGDQLFTDVLGAKLYGLRVILVDPLVVHDPLWTRPLRMAERGILRSFPRVPKA